jgi:hypothetical protein
MTRSIRTPKRRAAILDAMAHGLTMGEAAAIAGVNRCSIWEWRRDDPEFHADFEAAYEAGTDRFERVARERAFTESDALLIFLLKSRDPQRFNRRMLAIGGDESAPPIGVDHTHHMGRPMIPEPVRQIIMPDNGRADGPGIQPRPQKRLPFQMPETAMRITDAGGNVVALTVDGEDVHPEDIPATVEAIDAFNAQVDQQMAEGNGTVLEQIAEYDDAEETDDDDADPEDAIAGGG